MARNRVGECDIDGLTRAYTRAHGVPDEWKTRARCRGMNHGDGRLALAWIADKNDVVFGVPGEALNEMALQFCAMCPAQWECAAYAVLADEPWGIWSMPFEDLHWLKRQADPGRIVESAQAAGTPVQFAIRTARSSVGSLTAC